MQQDGLQRHAQHPFDSVYLRVRKGAQESNCVSHQRVIESQKKNNSHITQTSRSSASPHEHNNKPHTQHKPPPHRNQTRFMMFTTLALMVFLLHKVRHPQSHAVRRSTIDHGEHVGRKIHVRVQVYQCLLIACGAH